MKSRTYCFEDCRGRCPLPLSEGKLFIPLQGVINNQLNLGAVVYIVEGRQTQDQFSD